MPSAISDFFGGGGDTDVDLDNIFAQKGNVIAGERGAAESAKIRQLGIDEVRKQLGISRTDLDPFLQAGLAQLPELQRGATAQGLDEIFGEIFGTEVFPRLLEERTRATQNALSAGGFTRSGKALRELSAIPSDLGLEIQALLSGRQDVLAERGRAAGTTLGQFGLTGSGQIGNLLNASAGDIFAGIVSDAQRADALVKSRAGLEESRAARNQAAESDLIGGVLGLGGTLGSAAIIASDRRLKKNIGKIGEIGSLNYYQWDWSKEAKATFIGKMPTMGFMADEVEEKYPNYIVNICGIKAIKYPALLTQLEAENMILAA